MTIDRSIPCIIRVGTVTPGWEPIARVPVIRRAEHKREVVTVMTVPPVLIVPLGFVVAKNCVFLALPVLASLDPSPLLEFYGWRLRSVRLFCKIEVLRLDWLVLRELSFHCVLVRLACSANLGSIRCFACLSLGLE